MGRTSSCWTFRCRTAPGIETFLRVNSEPRTLPIVVLTGLDDEALAIETVQRGAQDYLVKGRVDDRILVRSLRYAIERKKTQHRIEDAHADDLERRVAERTEELTAANEKLQDGNSRSANARKPPCWRATGNWPMRWRNCARRRSMSSSGSACTRWDAWRAASRTISTTPSRRSWALASCCSAGPRPCQEERARGYIEMIHTAAEDSAKIVARLREFYRYREETDLFTPVRSTTWSSRSSR